MMRDALAHQGVSSGNGRHTREEIADKYGESPRQIARFIRLTSLNRPLLELVDRGKLQMGHGGGDQLSGYRNAVLGHGHTLKPPEDACHRAGKGTAGRAAYGEGALTQEAFAGIMLTGGGQSGRRGKGLCAPHAGGIFPQHDRRGCNGTSCGNWLKPTSAGRT